MNKIDIPEVRDKLEELTKQVTHPPVIHWHHTYTPDKKVAGHTRVLGIKHIPTLLIHPNPIY